MADDPMAGTTPAGAPLAAPPADRSVADDLMADDPAGTPLADDPMAGTPPASAPLAAPSADRPMADDPMADHPAGTPLAIAPSWPTGRMADDPDGRPPSRYPAGHRPAGRPAADDPMADHPADSPLASVPLASVSPETVAPAPVPVPSAVSAAADDGAQAATGSWPAYPSVGTDPYSDPVSAGDALPYPDEDDSADLPVPPGFYDPPDAALAGIAPVGDIGGRAARRQRVPTREIFCELADLASIPRAAYALETETDGAICLLPTPDGFDVFMAADGARHELRSFAEEEAAYFYLFGVLAADAVRSGALAPTVTMANPHGGTV